MRYLNMAPVLALAVLVTAPALAAGSSKAEVKTEEQKISYALGANIGQGVKQAGFDFDVAALTAAIEDVLKDNEMAMSDEEIQQTLQQFQETMRAKNQAKQEQEMGENKEAGAKYLEENKKKEGVKVTESGLQYEVMQEGEGKQPKATDTVKVHYRGTLITGEEFDSSYSRGQPAEFPLNRVIAGWTEGVQLMKEGAKYKFTIPYDLAYGERGSPPRIPPYSTLVFEVELLEVK